jgi:hypothetical protein
VLAYLPLLLTSINQLKKNKTEPDVEIGFEWYLIKEVLPINRICNCQVLVEWRYQLHPPGFHGAVHGILKSINRTLAKRSLIFIPSLALVDSLGNILLSHNVQWISMTINLATPFKIDK